MNHHVSTDVFGNYYLEEMRNRERAIKVLELVPSSTPIRKLTYADFAPKHTRHTKQPTDEETQADKAKAKRKQLAAECIDLLRRQGALTTAQLSRETGKPARAVSCALDEVVGIEREQINGARSETTGHVSKSVLWMMPIRVT